MTEEKKKAVDVYQALFKVQSTVDVVRKTADNPFFKSKYADLPDVWDAVKNALKENDLLVYHKTVSNDSDYLDTFIRHIPSGTEISSNMRLHLQKPTSQEYGSCITYMRRYAISSMLGLVMENDDDDGNNASQKKADDKKPEPKKPEIKPVDGAEFLAIQKAIRGSTPFTFEEEKAKAKAAWSRMNKAHQDAITKAVKDKETEISKLKAHEEDQIPMAWDENGNPIQ